LPPPPIQNTTHFIDIVDYYPTMLGQDFDIILSSKSDSEIDVQDRW